MLHPIEHKFATNAKNHGLLQQRDIVLIGVSGGCDSVALLYLFLAIRSIWQLDLHVVHFDHGLRPESPEEHQFVQALAQSHSLPFHSYFSKDLKHFTSGIQEKARKWRMATLESLSNEIGAQCIATAHHADDQIETVLHKLLRGCHLSNFRGMNWKTGLYIKPLLNFHKTELQQYLVQQNQSWKEDSSNQSHKYLRNRIRLELIPLMDELAKGELHTRLYDLTQQSQQLRTWIEQSQKTTFPDDQITAQSISLPTLFSKPPMVQDHFLYQFLSHHGVSNLEYKHIEKIQNMLQTANEQWELHLPDSIHLKREGSFIFLNSPSAFSEQPTQMSSFQSLQIISQLGPKSQIHLRYLSPDEDIPSTGILLFNIPINQTLNIRYRQPGDRFHPHWKNKSIKLKDFLRDQKIPLHQRNHLPLICDSNEILAIYPYYRSHKVYHNPDNQLPLHIHISLQSEFLTF